MPPRCGAAARPELCPSPGSWGGVRGGRPAGATGGCCHPVGTTGRTRRPAWHPLPTPRLCPSAGTGAGGPACPRGPCPAPHGAPRRWPAALARAACPAEFRGCCYFQQLTSPSSSWREPGVQVAGSCRLLLPFGCGCWPVAPPAALGVPLGAVPRPAHLPRCPTPALLLPSHQLLAPHQQLAVSRAATFLLVSLASHDGLPKAPDPGATCWEEAVSQEQADSPAVGGDS